MFYLPKVWTSYSLAPKTSRIIKHKTFFTKTENTLYNSYYPINMSSTTQSIFVFRKNKNISLFIPLPLMVRFSKISSINLKKSQYVLQQIICDLVYNFSFNTLYYFFKKLFWIVPVPKHKQLLYLLRAIFKFAFTLTNAWTGLSVTLRGKLAATGNKRTTTFKCLLGNGSASNILGLNQTDFRNITTTTGIIGVTSIITYTR